jgi:hypothetical protein
MKQIKSLSFKKRLKNRIFRIAPLAWALRFISDRYESIQNPYSKSRINLSEKGWSVVVITDGNNDHSLYKFVNSVKKELDGTPYEIIIVGPSKINSRYLTDKNIKIVSYKELGWISGWITRKKNLGVRNAKFENVVICHDYIVFNEGWKKGFDMFGNSFDVCTNRIFNMDGTRHYDWITYDYPGIGFGLLPYDVECTEYQYIGGNYIVVKRDFYLKYPLNENLRWGEAEDIEWSKEIRQHTIFKFNPHSSITFSKHKSTIKGDWLENSAKLAEIFKSK